MAATNGLVGAEDRGAGQSEIAHRVEHLVPNEFLRMTQAFRVHDLIVAEGDRVVERSAKRQAGLPELFDIAHEAKGAGAGQLRAKTRRGQLKRQTLATNQVRWKIDFNIKIETGTGRQFAVAVSILDANSS